MREYFCGLDVATAETALCIVDDKGDVVLETKVPSDPASIAAALQPFAAGLRRVGHEAGSLSPWLQPELKALGLPAHCLETRHVRAALDAQRNKTDRHDALGLAQMMRTGWFKSVHVKSEASYRIRLLIANRRNLKRKFFDLENAIRQSLKAFGIKVMAVATRTTFDAKVRELTAHDAVLTALCDAMLRARAALWNEYTRLHKLSGQCRLEGGGPPEPYSKRRRRTPPPAPSPPRGGGMYNTPRWAHCCSAREQGAAAPPRSNVGRPVGRALASA